MNWRKWTAALLTGVCCMTAMTGCAKFTPLNAPVEEETSVAAEDTAYRGKLTLVVSQRDEYLTYLDQAAKAAAEARGCSIESFDCGGDMNKQIQYVQTAAESGSKAILVVLADDARADEVVQAASEAKVVFVNRIPQDLSVLDENHVYVGSNEDECGAFQGEQLVEYLKRENKTSVNYLLFKGTEGLVHTKKRSEGALKALEAAGIQATPAAEPADCGYDRSKAMEHMAVLLADGLDMKNVDCIIANNDAMALGVIEALRQNDIDPNSVAIIGVDGTAAGLQAVRDGEMIGTVYQNAIAQASGAVQAAINLVSEAELMNEISFEQDKGNPSIIWVPFQPVTPHNITDFE